MSKVVFFILPGSEIMDFAGPMQTFFCASEFGCNYTMHYCSTDRELKTAQGLSLSSLQHFNEFSLSADDILFIPGTDHEYYTDGALFNHPPELFSWLRECNDNGAKICTVCTGTFILAHSGVLDGKNCTTHWCRVKELQETHKKLIVHEDRLYIKDGNVYTSAGIASGIDLSLYILEELHGPLLTLQVAKEMVVYIRRDTTEKQRSIYLDYRNHINPAIHRLQDMILQNPEKNYTQDDLAESIFMSIRNMTRLFKKATGVTIKEYSHRVKIEYGQKLLRDPEITIEQAAVSCGYGDSRQFRRIWNKYFGESPSSLV